MTKPELLEKLNELATCSDKEAAHSQADSLLLAFINDPEIEAAYDAIEKWYA